ncbi:bleomycin resistance protein [Roseibium algae]|uniref:Bleomycin resistance protein n=1 Tax=Roseibium algae TaxID=3123038 RepID=A0ABU8TN18_9HYPH
MSDEVDCIPVLPSLNLAESKAFYEGQLGFVVVHEDPTRLIVRRGTIELHFWPTDRKELCEASSCYIRGGGIDVLYDAFSQAKVAGLSAFEVRPWNMKEFYIHDPHGNLLAFGRIPEVEAA